MPGRHLVLRLLEHGGADDGLVVVLHIILRHLALVYLLLLGEEVHRVHLLQESVAFIFFVGKNAFDRAGRPCLLAAGRWDALRRQQFCDCVGRAPLQEEAVNPADGLRLFLVDDEVSIFAPVVAQEPLERHRDLAVREPLPLPPGAVLRDAPALLLRQRGHDGKEQLALAVKCPDIFFFKIALHFVFLQFPDSGQAVHRVPCETAHRLRDDEVNAAVQGIRHHFVKTVALCRGSRTDPFVRFCQARTKNIL